MYAHTKLLTKNKNPEEITDQNIKLTNDCFSCWEVCMCLKLTPIKKRVQSIARPPQAVTFITQCSALSCQNLGL